MRFPRIRLRLPRISFDWLGGVIDRTVLLYGVFTLVLFLVFLIVNFPHDILIRRAVSQLRLEPIQLDFQSAHFAWHRGYELRGLQLLANGGGEMPPLLECSTVDLWPNLGGLVRGEFRGVSLDGELYGGHASGEWVVSDGGGAGHVELSGLEVGRYRALAAQFDEGQVTGQLSAAVTVQLNGSERRKAELNAELSIARPAFTGLKVKGFTIPDLQFAEAQGKVNVKGERVELQEFKATGDQLTVQLSGSITMREPVGASPINLRAILQPSAATPDGIKAMLALIPRRPNTAPDAPITITGTLGSPQLR
jgi:type II secretion system protein N